MVNPMIRAVGFDFDDTLILSEEDNAGIYEEIFQKKYGLTTGVGDHYRKLVGKASREEKLRTRVEALTGEKPTDELGINVIGIQSDFSYRRLLDDLGAVFTFSSLCILPYEHLTHDHLYENIGRVGE